MTSQTIAPTSARAAMASIWLAGGRILTKSMDFVTLLVLARLLLPADFGLIALAMSVILIIEGVLALPLIQALVRMPNPTPSMYETAFTLGLIRGGVIALIVALLAHPFARFFDDPRLVGLICALALSPILSGLASPRLAVFQARIDFRRNVWMELSGKLASLFVATAIAMTTRSYWAIAAATITAPAVAAIVSYVFAPFRPRLSLTDWRQFADIISWQSAAQFFDSVGWQLDKLVLGRFTSPEALGRFYFADNITATPLRSVIAPLVLPLTAAFASVESLEARRMAYCKASSALVAIGAPVMISLGLLAEPAIRIAFGDKWREAAPLLTWMALSSVLLLPVNPMPAVALVLKKTKLIAFRTLVVLLIRAPALVAGVILFGVFGALAARTLASFCALLLGMFLVKRLIGLSLRRQAGGLARFVPALAVMAAFLLCAAPFLKALPTGLSLILALAGVAGTGLAIYGGVALATWALAGKPAGVEAMIINAVKARLRKIRPA